MTIQQKRKVHTIIHSASALAGGIGAGLAQLPCADSAAIVPIQITMVISLGAVFGIRLNQITATSSLATATATMTGRSISQILVGWIPVIGNVFNATVAAAITQVIGWTVACDFDKRTNVNLKGKSNKDNM